MGLSIGIVGLPNVGKSTLFSALTKRQGFSANYPFTTIEPNSGIVDVADERLVELTKLEHPKKTIPATVEFVDIAGLVEGANKGEGLGNQFLANIREADAICEVVRFFSDEDVIHVAGEVNPSSDVEVINTEFLLADIATLERQIPKLQKEAKGNNKEASTKLQLAERIKDALNNGIAARDVQMSEEERTLARDFFLLSAKPIIYVANVDEDALNSADIELAGQRAIKVCAAIEAELADLSDSEAKEYLESLGLAESGLERLIKTAYAVLGLQSFFTAGPDEVRAWTIPVGAKAPQAAGVIHTDFEKGFIKAEVASYRDYIAYSGEAGCRAAGKLRQEGKDYVVQDGDVMHFKFNV